jgi:membrane-bound lytic murein transglycosylase A
MTLAWPLRAVVFLVAALGAGGLLAGCTHPEPSRLSLEPVELRALPGWRAEHLAEALPGLMRHCAHLALMPADKPLGGEGEAARLGGTPAQWAAGCAAVRRLRPGYGTAAAQEARARAVLERYFQAFAVADNYKPGSLLTGYYEPELSGSRVQSDDFPAPLFAPPPSGGRSGRGGRGLDRAAIDGGALAGQGLELVWLSDPVDLFFLQIQGSGRVKLPDGTVMRVGYAGQNGRPFIDIGRIMARRGLLGPNQQSMLAICDWLRAHKDTAPTVMAANPSYVFFREVPGLGPDDGPLGAFGESLTPGRSVAVDPAFVPLGGLLWLDARDPSDRAPLQRLAFAEDVGGGIKGPGRTDVFFGWGAEAERHAGGMWARGRTFLLLPREAETLVARAP